MAGNMLRKSDRREKVPLIFILRRILFGTDKPIEFLKGQNGMRLCSNVMALGSELRMSGQARGCF